MTRVALMRYGLALLLLALTGCSTVWYRTGGVSPERFAQDDFGCSQAGAMLPRTPQSVTAIGNTLYYSDPTLGWANVAAMWGTYGRCMEAMGYRRTP